MYFLMIFQSFCSTAENHVYVGKYDFVLVAKISAYVLMNFLR